MCLAMNVLIMAQGEQRRLPKMEIGCAKQMLPVAGEPIIARTARLVREMAPWASVRIIGRWNDFSGVGPVVELADPGFCVLDGMAGALDFVETGRVITLLGDVVWSRDALRALLHDESPIAFAGTRELTLSTGEIFGCVFSDRETLKLALDSTPCRYRISSPNPRAPLPMTYATGQQGGHLRNLLFFVQWGRTRRVKNERLPWWDERYYVPIDDWTTDIDTPKDVDTLPMLSAMVRVDDAAEEGP